MLTKEDIRNLLARRFCNDIHKKLSEIPTPSALKDIYKGANRIKEAIERNEHIAIVGDYDVDGVVSSVILAEFFDDLGVKNYLVKIPNRFKDGYGLNPEIIDELASDVSLIITVDNGISANEAASICKEKRHRSHHHRSPHATSHFARSLRHNQSKTRGLQLSKYRNLRC